MSSPTDAPLTVMCTTHAGLCPDLIRAHRWTYPGSGHLARHPYEASPHQPGACWCGASDTHPNHIHQEHR